MKNLIYVFLGSWVLFCCAPASVTTTTTSSATTVTEVLSPAGLWDYTITGTPEGDFAGILTITQAGQLLNATLALRNKEFPLRNFAYNNETKKLTGELHYSGLVIAFDALLTGDELTGAMAEGGMDFPFKARRKK